MLLALSAFEQPVAALFDGDAVCNLLATTDSGISDRTTSGVIASFPLYDISWFACESSVRQRLLQPDHLVEGTSMLTMQQKRELIAGARELLVF